MEKVFRVVIYQEKKLDVTPAERRVEYLVWLDEPGRRRLNETLREYCRSGWISDWLIADVEAEAVSLADYLAELSMSYDLPSQAKRWFPESEPWFPE